MVEAGEDTAAYNRAELMDAKYDGTELSQRADEMIRMFQADASREAGVFHHLITLPTYHTTALHMNDLVEGYFGDKGMLASGGEKNTSNQFEIKAEEPAIAGDK